MPACSKAPSSKPAYAFGPSRSETMPPTAAGIACSRHSGQSRRIPKGDGNPQAQGGFAMSVTDEVLKNNEAYAHQFNAGSLPMPPAKKLFVLACMDARLQVSKILGLKEGDARLPECRWGG